MPAPSPTISLRLKPASRERLDRVTEKTHRSRSYIMQVALDRHLDDIEREEASLTKKGHLSTLLSLAGSGYNPAAPRTALEIAEYTNWLRGNE